MKSEHREAWKGIEGVLVVDPQVVPQTKNYNGIPFTGLYDAFPMMKWTQPLGIPRAVTLDPSYNGVSAFALPLSQMMKWELHKGRIAAS